MFPTFSLDVKATFQEEDDLFGAQELSESSGRPGLPVPNTPYGLCGRDATLDWMTKALH